LRVYRPGSGLGRRPFSAKLSIQCPELAKRSSDGIALCLELQVLEIQEVRLDITQQLFLSWPERHLERAVDDGEQCLVKIPDSAEVGELVARHEDQWLL